MHQATTHDLKDQTLINSEDRQDFQVKTSCITVVASRAIQLATALLLHRLTKLELASGVIAHLAEEPHRTLTLQFHREVTRGNILASTFLTAALVSRSHLISPQRN
jgi:hypothetical protein